MDRIGLAETGVRTLAGFGQRGFFFYTHRIAVVLKSLIFENLVCLTEQIESGYSTQFAKLTGG
jgi:hypothetical protein